MQINRAPLILIIFVVGDENEKMFGRLGILVDFFSHSTINGFMGGTAVILILQQLKDLLGMKHFSRKTNLVAVVKAIIQNRHEVSIKQIDRSI